MIKTVWFDIGGTVHVQDATLVNDAAFAERLYFFLKEHNIETAQTPEQLLSRVDEGAKKYKTFSEQELVELPGDEIWHSFMLGDFDVSLEKLCGLGEKLSYLYDRHRKVITRREGLEHTLQALKEEGFRLGVISNIMSTSFVPRILEEHGIAQYFEFIITSSEYGVRKPRRELFDSAVSLMGVTAHEAAYVGDTISRDVRGARAAGWELMIQIENPRIAQKDIKYLNCGDQPDYMVQSLREIPPILKQFNTERKERGSDS